MTILEKNHMAWAAAKPTVRRAEPKFGLSPVAARFLRDTRGAAAIEYALISCLIFLAIVAALHFYADRVAEMYQYIGHAIARST